MFVSNRFHPWWPVLLLLAMMLFGCERVLQAEERPYLDMPAEGRVTVLRPGETLEVVARFLAVRHEPERWALVWQRDEGGPVHNEALPLHRAPGRLEGRLVWPATPLPPGTYRVWVEAEDVPEPQRRSQEAVVRVLSSGEVHAFQLQPAPSQVSPAIMPTRIPPSPPRPTTPVRPPTATPLPVPTATPVPCYRARFVADVTLPDGTVIEPYRTYTKTWRLQNTGSCTWPPETYVIWIDDFVLHPGGEINPSLAYRIGRPVAPGETVDISIQIGATFDTPGRYRSRFMLALP